MAGEVRIVRGHLLSVHTASYASLSMAGTREGIDEASQVVNRSSPSYAPSAVSGRFIQSLSSFSRSFLRTMLMSSFALSPEEGGG